MIVPEPFLKSSIMQIVRDSRCIESPALYSNNRIRRQGAPVLYDTKKQLAVPDTNQLVTKTPYNLFGATR